MDFAPSPEQQAVRSAIEAICARFGDDYWLRRDRAGGFPEDFHRAVAEGGWLGIAMPPEYGGAGLGIAAAATMMEAPAASGAGMSGASALLARTTPLAQASAPARGLSLFYTDLDRSRVQVREIEKLGRKAVDSNELFIDGLEVPVGDRIGEEGRGFEYILHGMNPERILIGAEAVGLGRVALQRAAKYAGERIVLSPVQSSLRVFHGWA